MTDSSRFWPKEGHVVGQGQKSFDKQLLRDWLTSRHLDGVEDVTMPEDVVSETAEKYKEVYHILTGEKWS